MAKNQLLFFLMLLLAFNCNALAKERFEFKKEDMDFAKDLARKSRQVGMSAIKGKWLEFKQIQLNKRLTGNFDLEARQELNIDEVPNNLTLRVFVSSSMGNELLKHYVQQAKRYGAILVFNGLPDGSWLKLSDLIYEITGGESKAIAIQLDDGAFDQYQIVSVPSFVLSIEPSVFDMNGVNDSDTKNIEKFDKVIGNTGIRRALEEIAAKGDLADEAIQLLDEVRS